MWTFTFWEQFAQDVRYGLRTMAANRLFTGMAVLSLALGMGANTAIYSYMDAIMLRALPVNHPEQLVVLNWRAKNKTGWMNWRRLQLSVACKEHHDNYGWCDRRN